MIWTRPWEAFLVLAGIGLCLLPLAGGGALAQAARDPQTEIRRTDEERRRFERNIDAVHRSREQRFIQGRRVAYDEVLKRPDDIALNLAFARTQIRDGDLIGASATLERILLVVPRNRDVRILYAIVLYRLDNVVEARRLLQQVLATELPPSLRGELEVYLDDLKRRSRRTNLSVILGGAYVFDTNRNSSPSSELIDTATGRVNLFGTDRSIHDSSFLGQIRIGVEHDLGFQRQHRIVGWVRGLHSEQMRLDRLTSSGLDGELRLILDFNPVTIEPWVQANYVLLSHQQYFRSVGGGLAVRFPVSRKLRLSLFGSAVADNFDDLSEKPIEHLRSGAEYRASIEAAYRLSTDMRLILRSTGLRKSAGVDFYSYWATRQRLQHEWLLGKGMFLLSNLGWEYEFYDAGDPNDGGMRRHQHRIIAGATVGVPISTILSSPDLISLTRRATLTAGVEFTRALSNVTNYTHSNWRFMVGLTVSATQ